MSVTVWGNTKDPRPAIVDYLRDLLNEIGFKAKTKVLDQQVYFGTIGLKKTQAQAGFTDWFSDFPHPADFFEPNLSKASLQSSPTFNFQFKSNPVVDAGLKKLTPQDPKTVADEWAKLDRSVVENANATVYGQRAVDGVLLGANGLRELQRRQPDLQDRLVAVLSEVTRVAAAGRALARPSGRRAPDARARWRPSR